jgi:hypothetical protein
MAQMVGPKKGQHIEIYKVGQGVGRNLFRGQMMDVQTKLLLRKSSPSSDSTAATLKKAVAPRGDNDDDETKKRDARGKKC